MIVIADTSPICYLILIKQIGILPVLFQTVQVPPQVISELIDEYNNHPEIVAWAKSPPAWLKVTAPQQILAGIALDLGEVAAIRLALEIRADLLLVDDLSARHAAVAHGIPIAGTIAVLELAAKRGLVELENSLQDLRQTNFRVSTKLLDKILADHAEWKKTQGP